MKVKGISIVLILSCLTLLEGQNLVLNHDFEQFDSSYIDKKDYGSFSINDFPAFEFYVPNNSTPDFIHCCYAFQNYDLNKILRIRYPYIFRHENQYSGNACAGLFVLRTDGYAEQLTGTLIDQLKKDYVYKIEFYLKIAPISKFAIDKIGIKFSANKEFLFYNYLPYYQDMFEEKSRSRADIEFDVSENSISTEYVRYVGYYKAKGGERYFTFGYFLQRSKKLADFLNRNQELNGIEDERSKPNTKINGISPWLHLNKTDIDSTGYTLIDGAYYFLDQISLYKVD